MDSAEDSSPLLLHSIATFAGALVPLLGALAPRSFCEIGIEDGLMTRFLLDFSRARGCRYVGIDPNVPPDLASGVRAEGHVIYDERSLDVLSGIPPCDVYFVDGDHNYYTIFNELRLVFDALGTDDREPVFFFHDVGWPWGRRDLYYDPTRIPEASRHDHDFHRGVTPTAPGVIEGGFRSDGRFAIACHEGGPKNGVLSAIEDFIAERAPDWQLLTVPVIFGLGILYRPGSLTPEQAAAFRAFRETVDSWRDLLSRMERNRLELYLTVLERQDWMENARKEIVALETAIRQEATHSRAAEQELRRTRGLLEEVEQERQRNRASLRSLSVDVERLTELVHQLMAPTSPSRVLSDGLRRFGGHGRRVLGTVARLRPFVMRRGRAARPVTVSGLASIPALIDRFDVVSFDLFDTLVRRNIEPPEFLRRRLAKFAELFFARQGLPASYPLLLFARDRVESDQRAAAQRENEDGECKLSETLYGMLERLFGEKIAACHTDRLLRYELEIEKQHLRLAPNAREVLQKVRRRGKRCVAVSDMYLEEDHLRELLEHLGIVDHFDAIYVSSEHGCGKHSGRLFAKVLEAEGVAPGRVVHVGDNDLSDVQRALSLGMAAIHFRDRAHTRRRRRVARITGSAVRRGNAGPLLDLVSKQDSSRTGARGRSSANQHGDLYRIGHEIVGPSFCAFVCDVVERCHRLGAEDVYFVSREGHLFQQLYRIAVRSVFRFRSLPSLRDRYLHASRLSTSLAAVERVGEREIQLARWRDPALSLRKCLETFGLAVEHFRDLVPASEIEDADEVLVGAGQKEALRRFVDGLAFQKRFAELRDEARSLLRRYLEQEGFFGGSQMKVLVDIGWHATIQDNLTRAFGREPDFPNVVGLYYGRRYADLHAYDANPKSVFSPGFAYDERRLLRDEQAIGRFVEFFEVCAAAPHGTTARYRNTPAGVEPVLEDGPSRLRPEIEAIQQGILDYAESFFSSFDIHEIDTWALQRHAAQRVARLIRKPTRREARAVRSLLHDLDWGSGKKVRLVTDEISVFSMLRPSRLRAALENARWIEGSLRLADVPFVFPLLAIYRTAVRGASRLERWQRSLRSLF